jgi:hypothetical protein
MNKLNFKVLSPHLAAIAIFLVVAIVYCRPALEGMSVEQQDLIQWKGMAQDGFNYREKHGHFPEWTNSMFGGMPAYQIAFESTAYLPAYVTQILGLFLPQPVQYFFLACVCFYFLALVFRINPWIGILAALGYAYASYNPIIIVTGHHTKMMTIAVMPALVASVLLIFEHRKYWLGFGLTALFTSIVVVNNHLQMVYYTLILLVFMAAAYAIQLIRKGELKHFITSAALSAGAAVLGALVCAVNLFTTYDYAPESMRGGKNQLVMDTADSTQTQTTRGLDADYAFRWSYGLPETFSLVVPNVNGGSSQSLGEESNFYTTLIEKVQGGQIEQGLAQQVAQFGTAYWGDQPFTSGPVYFGAVVFLLFLLGMVNGKGIHTWWILAASVFAILLAWGSNFMAFNKFLFDYLPLYNKFRAPSQSLVIPQLLFPLAGMLGLQKLLFDTPDAASRWKQLKATGILAAALLACVGIYYMTANYQSARESEALAQMASDPNLSTQVKEVFRAAREDRQAMFGGDLVRSFLLIGAAFLVLWLASRNKLNALLAVAALAVLSTGDLLAVGSRYLSEENYVEKEDTEVKNYVARTNPQLASVLTNLEKDPDLHFRVFNTTTDPFNDALSAAFVRSVGGYHPAKLSRYQDLIDYQLSKQNFRVFNMLNTKYFVVNTGQGITAQQNPDAYGAAWLVKHVHVVPNAVAEMKSLDSLNLRDTAIVEASQKQWLTASPVWDSTASIKLTVYDNDLIEYQVQANSPQFAVLSEVYYSRGWKAFADEKEIPIIKTNYLLRGVNLPAGTKKLSLRFEPDSYRKGKLVTASASLVIVLLLAAGLFQQFRKKKETRPTP